VDLLGAVGQVPSLVRVTQALGMAAIPLLQRLEAVDLVHLLDSGDRVLTQVDRSGVIDAAARSARLTPQILAAQQELIRLQRTTLRIQRRTLRAQLAGLGVQRETLVHARNLDRKTGGGGLPVPATP
jgi:hypothetical protein